MTDANFFNQILVWPIINLLMVFYKGLSFLQIPWAFGLAVISLTILIKLALYPLTIKQMASAKKMADLKPHLDKLSKKHSKDKQRLQKEQMELYRQHGINPAAGCLPMIIQFPILIALYQVFWQVLANGNLEKMVQDINSIVYTPLLRLSRAPDFSFLGISLAEKPSNWQAAGWWLLLIPLATAGFSYWQANLMSGTMRGTINKKEEKKEGEENMAETMQKQMKIMMPLMIGFFSYGFPAGLSLYWNTFTVFGIVEQSMKLRK